VIQLVCFSRNRPLQLHGYLASLFKFVADPELLEVTVLVRSDPEYAAAYAAVAAEFAPVRFVAERHFASDVLALMGDRDYTCFGCDDVVFVAPIALARILELFDARLFAFSLRLGRNVARSMFSGAMTPPPMLAAPEPFLLWDLHRAHGCGDWGYSWELNGTVYPTAIVRAVIEELRPASPNLLEAGGGGRWSNKTERHLMAAWPRARLVVPTVNVVQVDFANPVCGGGRLDPPFLLECWNRGLRMDIDAFARATYDCIHVADFFLRRE
jgi:hypothetical protein